MSDQADSNKPLEEKKEPELKGDGSVEAQQPKTPEGLLNTALSQKTEGFLSKHLFDTLGGTRKAMYGCALPLGIDAVINGSPDDLKRAAVFFTMSAGLGVIDAVKQWKKKKSVNHNTSDLTNLATAK